MATLCHSNAPLPLNQVSLAGTGSDVFIKPSSDAAGVASSAVVQFIVPSGSAVIFRVDGKSATELNEGFAGFDGMVILLEGRNEVDHFVFKGDAASSINVILYK